MLLSNLTYIQDNEIQGGGGGGVYSSIKNPKASRALKRALDPGR